MIAWTSDFFLWELVISYMHLAWVFTALPYTKEKKLYVETISLLPVVLGTCVILVPGSMLPIYEQSVHPIFQMQYFSSNAKIWNKELSPLPLSLLCT